MSVFQGGMEREKAPSGRMFEIRLKVLEWLKMSMEYRWMNKVAPEGSEDLNDKEIAVFPRRFVWINRVG